MATPWNWNTEEWGDYKPGKNDFSTKITEEALKGNTGGAAALEVLRNNYIGSDAYTGSKKQTNIFSGSVSSGAAAADSAAEKVVEKVKTTAAKVAEENPEEKPAATQVIYSGFDPANYAAQQISTPALSDTDTSNIIGIGIIAVIGFVILDKLLGK